MYVRACFGRGLYPSINETGKIRRLHEEIISYSEDAPLRSRLGVGPRAAARGLSIVPKHFEGPRLL